MSDFHGRGEHAQGGASRRLAQHGGAEAGDETRPTEREQQANDDKPVPDPWNSQGACSPACHAIFAIGSDQCTRHSEAWISVLPPIRSRFRLVVRSRRTRPPPPRQSPGRATCRAPPHAPRHTAFRQAPRTPAAATRSSAAAPRRTARRQSSSASRRPHRRGGARARLDRGVQLGETLETPRNLQQLVRLAGNLQTVEIAFARQLPVPLTRTRHAPSAARLRT